MTLIDGIRESAVSEEQIQVLELAASRIKTDNATIAYNAQSSNNNTGGEYIYSNRYSKTAHAALMYVMRPNAKYQRMSDEIVASLIPSDTSMDSSHLSIGLPIRGSDKCKSESICYGFEKYMKLMQLMWDEEQQQQQQQLLMVGDNGRQQQGNDAQGNDVVEKKGTIILTTEDPNIIKARKAYESNATFPFRFIINDRDVLQGSGNPKKFKGKADSIMLASLVSMKLQLHAKYVIGNCCSNFHLMLFDFVHAGCGASYDSSTVSGNHNNNAPSRAICLQEHPDPQFHICCGWSKTKECDDIRDAQAEEEGRQRRKKEEEEAAAA